MGDEKLMKDRNSKVACAAVAALMLAGMAAQSAQADGSKKKDKGPVVVVGKPVVTQDPPKKK